MANKETPTYFEDRFNRDDSSAVGNGWEVVGDVTISQETARQGAAAQAQGKILRDVPDGIGDNYEVDAVFAVEDDANSAAGRILFRRTAGDAADFAQGYSAGVEFASGVYRLVIRKRNNSATEVATTTLTASQLNLDSSDSPLGQAQALRVRVSNEEEYVKIQVFLNDEAEPLLSYNDYALPQWRRANQFGFAFSDMTTTSVVALAKIAIRSLGDAQTAPARPLGLWNFRRLKDHVRSLALRDSYAKVDDTFFGDLLNQALSEVGVAVGRAYWWEDLYSFKWPANQASFELPSDTAWLDDTIVDTDNDTPHSLYSEESFRRAYTSGGASTPVIYRWAGGRPGGGPVLRAEPMPASATNYEVRRFRSPQPMVSDSDMPDLPQEFCPTLVWGAVMLYSFRDSDRTHIRAASSQYDNLLQKVIHAARARQVAANRPILSSGLVRPTLFGGDRLAMSRYGIRR